MVRLRLWGCIFKRFTVHFQSRRRIVKVMHQGCQEVLVPGMSVCRWTNWITKLLSFPTEPRLHILVWFHVKLSRKKVLFDVIRATISVHDWESDTPLSLSFFSMSGFSPTQLAMLVIACMQVAAGSAPSCRRLAFKKWTTFWSWLQIPMSRNEWDISGLLFVLLQLFLCFRFRVVLLITKIDGVFLNWKGCGISESF